MYQQIKKKIEEEKSHLERDLQEISSLKKTPKVFKVFQKVQPLNISASPSSSYPLISTESPDIFQNFGEQKNQPRKAENLSEASQKEQTSQLQTQLHVFRVENENLWRENKTLKEKLQCQLKKSDQLELEKKRILCEEEEKSIRAQVEYSRIKELFKEAALKKQEQEQKLILMESEKYEQQIKLENLRAVLTKVEEQNDQLKSQIDSILIYIKQLNHSISSELQHHQELFQSLITDHSHLELQTPKQLRQSKDLRHPEIKDNVEQLHHYFNQLFSHNRLQQTEIMGLNHLISETLSTSMKYQRGVEVKENQCDKKNIKIQYLEGLLKSLAEEKQQLEACLQKTKIDMASTINKTEEIENNNEMKLKQAKTKLYQYEIELQHLKKVTAEDHKTIENLNKILNQNQRQIDSKLSLAETRQQELINEIKQLKDQMEKLIEEQEIYEKTIKDHQIIEETLRKEIVFFKQNLQNIVGRENSNHEEPKNNYEVEKIEQEYRVLQASQETLKQQYKDLENRLKTMTQDIKRIQHQKERIFDVNSKNENIIIQYEEQIKQWSAKDKIVEKEKEDLLIKLQEKQAILSTLKEQTMGIYLLEQNYQQLKAKNTELTQELEQYREKQRREDSSFAKEEKQRGTQQLELEDMKLKQDIFTLSEELKNYRETSISEKVVYEQKIQQLQQIILREQSLKQQLEILKDQLKDKNIFFEQIEEKCEITEEKLIHSQKELESQKQTKTKIELYNETLKNQINQLHSIITSLSEQINSLRKQPLTPKKGPQVDQHIQIHDILHKINSNCLKNNCDSVGIINIELRKLSKQVHCHLISSPTDCIPFNTKLEQIDEFQLNQKSKEEDIASDVNNLGNISNAEIKQKNHSEGDLEDGNEEKPERKIDHIAKRASYDGLLKISKAKPMRSSEALDCKKDTKDNKEVESSLKLQSQLSLQVNPDLECGILPYQELIKQYNIMKSEMQKMQEYINRLNSTNLKIRKSIQDVDNYAHFKTIDTIVSKFGMIISNKETALKHEGREFINQIQILLKEIQNYIHFIDRLSKIQPFTQYHRLNKIQRQGTTLLNRDKEKLQKKTYSEGQSPDDNLFQGFDGNVCEYQDFSPQQFALNHQEVKDIEKYFDENKELYSEISSVKNKSLKSYNSFINSRSEIWQFGFHSKKSPKKQRQPHKSELEDEDKLTFNDLKVRYEQMKQKNKILIMSKATLEKDCSKKIEDLENNYKRKLNKMTKEFNDSFKVLCKASDQQMKSKKQLSPQRRERETQALPVNQSNKIQSCESITISPGNRGEKQIQELQERLKEQQEKLKERELQYVEIEKKMKILKSQKNQMIKIIKEQKVEPLTSTLKKYNADFSVFMKTIAQKVPEKNIRAPIETTQIKETKFRKSSSSFKPIPVQSASTPNDERYGKLLQLLCDALKISETQLNLQMQFTAVKQIIDHTLIQIQKKAGLDIVQTVTEYIKKFLALENEEERFSRLEEIRLILSDYFGSPECVSQLIKNTNMLIRKLNCDSVTSVDHLSVNSYCEEFKLGSDKDKQEQEEQDLDNLVVRHSKLKEEKQKLLEKINQLTSEVRSLKDSNASRDVIIQWQEEEIKAFKQQKEKIEKKKEELLTFEKQKANLNEELAKLKQRSQKKSKVIYLGH